MSVSASVTYFFIAGGWKKRISLYCVLPLRKVIGWVLALACSHTCTNPMVTNSLSIFDLEEAGGHETRKETIQLEIIGKNSTVLSPFYGLGDVSKQKNSTYLSCFRKESQISSMKQLRYLLRSSLKSFKPCPKLFFLLKLSQTVRLN